MKIRFFRYMMLGPALALFCSLVSVGCNDAPTTAAVQNGYPPATIGGNPSTSMVVFKSWWVTTLFSNPISPGEISESQRTIPRTDFAYALLAPDWTVGRGVSPGRLIAVKSAQKLTASSHDLLTIVVSDDQFTGNCASGSILDSEDAQLIVERIFPGEFAGVTYDPGTCTSTPVSPDGGASSDAGEAADSGPPNDAATD